MGKSSSSATPLLALGALATGALVFAGTRSGVLPLPEPLTRRLPDVLLPRTRRRGALVSYTPVEVPLLDKKTGLPKVGKGGKRLVVIRSRESYAELANAASRALGRPIDPQTFLLASMVASEAGSMHELAKLGIAHTAMNYSRRNRRSIAALLAPDGRIGSQFGRYASTRHMPSAIDVAIAEKAATGAYGDPTGGAIQFDSPKAQQKGFEEGWAGYGSLDRLTERRRAAGLEPVALKGIPMDHLRFWRPRALAA